VAQKWVMTAMIVIYISEKKRETEFLLAAVVLFKT
jgi:hypothetical protein